MGDLNCYRNRKSDVACFERNLKLQLLVYNIIDIIDIERVKWNLTKESEKVRRGRVFFFF